MPNTIVTPQWVTKSVAAEFLNAITYLKNLTRTYDDQYKVNGAKVGFQVNARLPQRFQVGDGQALVTQALYNETVPITLTNQKHLGFAYPSADATMLIEEINDRYIKPAAEAVANACDVLAWQDTYKAVYNSIGVPGAGAPTDVNTYLDGGVLLSNSSCPTDNRVAVISPRAMARIAGAVTTFFNPSSKISEAFNKGQFGSDTLGFSEWYQDQNYPIHTTGTFTASTPVVNGASQTGSSLVTSGWASGATTLKKGDVFTIAGVYQVNKLSYQSTGELQQFVVTADASDTTGAITLSISPSIITSGQRQTVSGSPANSAAITVLGATDPVSGTLATTNSAQGMLFVKDFAAFVMADLEAPVGGVEVARVRAKKANISIRMVRQYNAQSDQNTTRLDVLVGAATILPEYACRVWM